MKIEIINDFWIDVTKDIDNDICLDGVEFRIYFKDDWLSRRHFVQFIIDCIRVLDEKQKKKVLSQSPTNKLEEKEQ